VTPEVEAHLAFLRGLEKRGDIKVNTGEAAKRGSKPLVNLLSAHIVKISIFLSHPTSHAFFDLDRK